MWRPKFFPWVKTGGLADVCAALPAALTRLGADVHLVMPAYEQALDLAVKPRVAVKLDDVLGFDKVRVYAARTPDSGLPVNLIDIPSLYRDGGGIYRNAGGRGSRLLELTDRRAKPAVYFGGKLRIIDFALSNALNSGIRRIAVAT